jgi:hypothetical protein
VVRNGAVVRISWLTAVSLLTVVLVVPGLWGCGSTPTDANEPNDELNAATALAPDVPLTGVIGQDDSDVFAAEAPKGDREHPFVVTVQTERPQDLELQVGASIPGVWEGITWPAWQAIKRDGRLELAGRLRKGTVLMFLKGIAGTRYTIAISW